MNGSPIEAAERSDISCRHCGLRIYRTPEHDIHITEYPSLFWANTPKEAWSDGVLLTCMPSDRRLWHEPRLPTLNEVRIGLQRIEEDLR